MQVTELKKGIWYKFYSPSNGKYWHLLPREDGNIHRCIAHIGDHGNGPFYTTGGNFSSNGREFTPSLAEEINPFLPEKIQDTQSYTIY